MVVVTHDAAVAAEADRVVEIADGRILADRVVRPRRPNPEQARDLASATVGRGRQVLEAVRNAGRTIAAHRLRNVMTILGMVIGVASVILAVAVGAASEREVLDRFAQFGPNTVEIGSRSRLSAGIPANRNPFTPDDVERLADLPFVLDVSPEEVTTATLRYGRAILQVQLYGVAPAFFAIHAIPILAGTAFSEKGLRHTQAEVVIDPRVREALFPDGENPLGATLLIGTMSAVVAGVARPELNSQYGFRPFAAMPYTAWSQRVTGQHSFSGVTARIADEMDRDLALALATIAKLLRAWHPPTTTSRSSTPRAPAKRFCGPRRCSACWSSRSPARPCSSPASG
ncbi:ABC transporter permease (plasmid) [Methylobacterium currus]|uniref:ABC transporter permease n=1 Tax=Methylobacterium currus TaxID=2051553 RepID=UPI001E2D348E|nr:ABC transporter permease [Methylobacterium currus]UHC19954.1 ABC transporter permease [Methylobacterium currus]